jgi:hypothetical protein
MTASVPLLQQLRLKRGYHRNHKSTKCFMDSARVCLTFAHVALGWPGLATDVDRCETVAFVASDHSGKG